MIGIVAGIAISSYYYEPLSTVLARWGGFFAVFLSIASFIVGVFIEKLRKQKFKPIVVGRVEQVGIDVIRAINATMKRAGLRRVEGSK